MPTSSRSSPCSLDDALLIRSRELLNSARDELRVVLDKADQGRPASVLPREPKEVQAGDVCHAAAVAQAPVGIEDRKLEPRVVRPVAGGPEHGVDLELAPVLEPDRAARGPDGARL